MTGPETLRIAAPGATLAVRHYPGDGDPIVLLHGGPGLGDYFGTFAGMFSPPYRVVSYDQRGCGRSTCERSFEIRNHVADLEAIRMNFGAARLRLLGHSWGGLLAQCYAKEHPGRVASLVLCCSMANTGSGASMESRGISERVLGVHKPFWPAWAAAGLLMQLPGKLGDIGYGYVMKQLLPNYMVRPDSAPTSFDPWRVSKRGWRATNRSIKAVGDHYLSGLAVQGPVLIIRGEQDVIRETHALLVERFPHATSVVVEGAGHFPWVERPDAFAKAALAFFRQAG